MLVSDGHTSLGIMYRLLIKPLIAAGFDGLEQTELRNLDAETKSLLREIREAGLVYSFHPCGDCKRTALVLNPSFGRFYEWLVNHLDGAFLQARAVVDIYTESDFPEPMPPVTGEMRNVYDWAGINRAGKLALTSDKEISEVKLHRWLLEPHTIAETADRFGVSKYYAETRLRQMVAKDYCDFKFNKNNDLIFFWVD